ncbi:MAG: Coenzyme F420 hydrogenase/dehydrogenase, beta subunit C-terminal domain [Cyclobacteriaceae bacterium]|nr:Coenzyme F420 hydrogenase/dehydrogenase, beta subunit C-terminal domain [Cyclobacteriaceae bacterium]
MSLELLDKVIKGGYCIGCGACTTSENSPYTIQTNEKGCYEAKLRAPTENFSDEAELKVCPFYESQLNEDVLSKKLFEHDNSYDEKIGWYQNIYAGRVKDNEYFLRGSSGGFAKWLLRKLLEKNLVDYVIQVYNNEGNPDNLFEYRVVNTLDEVDAGSKSVYYPVEMSEVLSFVKKNPGRYAITGVPCFIKGIRLLQQNEPIFAERIKFCIGIICGHLKSKYYAEMIGWQLGVKPKELSHIDFRVKIPGKKANEKGVQAKSITGFTSKAEIVQNIFGTNYGHGFFKYNACDYCDDVIAETADISIGDAWLPEYLGSGTSIIASRNENITNIINEYHESALTLDEIEPEKLYKSQEAGYRHRREGLSVRLALKSKKSHWYPKKRTHIDLTTITKKRARIYRQRVTLAQKSFRYYIKSKEKSDLSYFIKSMSFEIDLYGSLYKNKKSLKIRFYELLISLKIGIYLRNIKKNVEKYIYSNR